MSEWENAVDGNSSRLIFTKKKIAELEDIEVKIIKNEAYEWKRIFKNSVGYRETLQSNIM